MAIMERLREAWETYREDRDADRRLANESEHQRANGQVSRGGTTSLDWDDQRKESSTFVASTTEGVLQRLATENHGGRIELINEREVAVSADQIAQNYRPAL